jgi:hypothetical protein
MKNEDQGGEYGSSLPLSLCSDCLAIKTGPKRSPRGSCQGDQLNHSATNVPKSYASCTNGSGYLIRWYSFAGMNYRNNPNQSLEDSESHDQDFDDSANELWSLYGKEAKSQDEARIKTLKDDMDGVLIYVCICLLWLAWVDVTGSRLVYYLVFSPRSSCQRSRI